jgi:pyruvate formate lyase activating enzyme
MRAEELIALALEEGSGQLAYTYSEPLVHAEYLLDAMEAAKKAGLANILVTNGTVLSQAADEILSLTDAVNVDLKSFSENSYKEVLGGSLAPVLAFIEKAHELGVHTEITTLVVTGLNDTMEELDRTASFIRGISRNIPWHLSAYHPDYRWNGPPANTDFLVEAAGRFRKILNHVFTGNMSDRGFSDTLCPGCGQILIKRRAYSIETPALVVTDKTARCAACGEKADFIRI